MLPNLDFVRQMQEDERDIQAQMAANPQSADLLSFIFSLLPNAAASMLDPEAEYDPDRTYSTLLADQGMHWIPAGLLGTALDLLEPGPGEFVRAAKGVGAAAASIPTLLRAQNRAVGRSAFRSLGPDEVSRYADAVRSMDPSKRGFLTPYSADDLSRMVGEGYEVFLDERGVGYILSPDKDLQGVINASGIRGAGEDAIRDAISRGAVTLDAFDGHLPNYYRRFGFEETGRATFDPQYAPADWDYQKYGTPDVVFMRLRGR